MFRIARRIRRVILASALVAAPAAVSPGVTAAATARAASLMVAPVPQPGEQPTATPRITWSTGTGAPGLITVTPLGSPKAATVAAGSEGAVQAPWIQATNEYTFRLYETAPRRKELVELVVGRGEQTVLRNAAPDDPINTPASVDRLLEVFPYGLGMLVLLLTTSYLRGLRRD